jgi:hypothetical protein
MALTSRVIISNVLGLVGAVAGGVLGYYIFLWLIDQGFYGLMIPGALLGLGCGLLSGHASQVRGVLCGIAAVFLGMFSEWHFKWFADDPSFGYLVTHFHQKATLTIVMLVLGAFFAYWLGKDAGFLRLTGGRPLVGSGPSQSPPSSN